VSNYFVVQSFVTFFGSLLMSVLDSSTSKQHGKSKNAILKITDILATLFSVSLASFLPACSGLHCSKTADVVVA